MNDRLSTFDTRFKTGFKRSKPVVGKDDKALMQSLARVFIDLAHSKGYHVNEIEAKLIEEGKCNIYRGKIAQMASGAARPYQYLYFFQVLFASIGYDIMDVLVVRDPKEVFESLSS